MEQATGKINRFTLSDVITEKTGRARKEVIVGPEFGVDVSLSRIGNGQVLAATSDPLTLIPALGLQESAWLSVQLLANDMATTGFAPMFGQFVLNLPSGFARDDFKKYWEYIHHYCDRLGVSITGGHTAFIEEQNSTIAGGGTFFTIAPEDVIRTSKGAKTGDAILVTKQCALSTTAILARCFPSTIRNELGCDVYESAMELFYQTSSLEDALLAVNHNKTPTGVTALHDVTEGGVFGAIYELATASGKGALIFADKIPIGHVQSAVCSLFNLDSRHCIGAGSMIITCNQQEVATVIGRLEGQNISCSEVGVVTESANGIRLLDGAEMKKIEYKEKDPYWNAFSTAIKKGWK